MTLTRLNISALTLIVLLLAGLQPQAYAKDSSVEFARPALCTALLAGSSNSSSPSAHELTPTQLLTAYLTDLLNQKTIGHEELNRFIGGLENGGLINPISEEKAVLTSTVQIHFEGIQSHLDSGNDLDRGELLAWAKESLHRLQQIQVERTEARNEAEKPYRKITFHSIPAGSFLRWVFEGNILRTTLTHPFAAMETKVTQWQWAQVMGDNPSHFVDGPDSIEMEIHGKKVRINPDHPVEMITWWSALVFANRLSELNGLQPAYDLSGIEFVDMSVVKPRPTLEAHDILRVAAKGRLGGRPRLSQPKINAQKGDMYEAEGFRLPTFAEQLYFLSNAGISNGEYYFGDDSKQLKYHAWYKENSKGKTHPVGLLRPMSIGKGLFYDVLGNVYEWAYDKTHTRTGVNPIFDISTEATISGGSYDEMPSRMFSRDLCHWLYDAENTYYLSNHYNGNVGLRLVRTLKPGSPIIERVRTQ